LELKIVLIN